MKKYSKVFRQDYETWHEKNQDYRDRVKASPHRQSYHLMPETGWLNDPNGLCQFKGVYHIYYQYTPFEPTGEIKLWGHCTTRDFVHYSEEEPALFPDQDFDAHGVYSGSALVEKDTIHYFYTGNVKYFDRDDYDYITAGRGSNTVHFTSCDGYSFSEKKLLMTTADYPEDVSCHVRDPKIWKEGETYYMALGARDKGGRGLTLLYESGDLESWKYHGRITSQEPLGYMWECPDLFRLDEKLCLICCPQGTGPRGLDFWNIHQCAAVMLDYDFGQGEYRIEDTSAFVQLDRGFDFYAPQTFQDEGGRRILIGWMGIPDAGYTNPTVKDGWQHCLTIPRVLHIEEGRLIQQPVRELEALRGEGREFSLGELGKDTDEKNTDKHVLCHILEKGRNTGLIYECLIEFQDCRSMAMTLRPGAVLTYEDGIMTLDIEPVGSGRTRRKVELPALKDLRIFSDVSSLEIFVNGGREVFTTRVYGEEGGVRLEGDCRGAGVIYQLNSFTYE